MPVRTVRSGWDNAVFRLGESLAVRVPRRELAVPLLRHEQRWLPELAPRLPLAVPVPVFAGAAQPGYPWPWSVVPWFDGAPAAAALPAGGLGEGAVTTIADFLRALHVPAPAEAPASRARGVPLRERSGAVLARLQDPRHRAAWLRWSAAPPWEGPPLWLHGDLHPLNIIVDGAGLPAAIIDFGDLTAGDPAYDLAVAWMVFDEPRRRAFRRRVERSRAPLAWGPLWSRARAFALSMAVLFRDTGSPGSPEEAIGAFALRQLRLG